MIGASSYLTSVDVTTKTSSPLRKLRFLWKSGREAVDGRSHVRDCQPGSAQPPLPKRQIQLTLAVR